MAGLLRIHPERGMHTLLLVPAIDNRAGVAAHGALEYLRGEASPAPPAWSPTGSAWPSGAEESSGDTIVSIAVAYRLTLQAP